MKEYRHIVNIIVLLSFVAINIVYFNDIVSFFRTNSLETSIRNENLTSIDENLTLKGNFLIEYAEISGENIVVPVSENGGNIVKYLVIINSRDISEIKKAIETGTIFKYSDDFSIDKKSSKKWLSLFSGNDKLIFSKNLMVVDLRRSQDVIGLLMLDFFVFVFLVFVLLKALQTQQFRQKK